MERKIIHIDLDAFFAQVEERDYPELRGKPVVVGGDPARGRGVVTSASYAARKFGIRSAMSSMQARRLCPEAVFVSPHFAAYKEASAKIRQVFHSVTQLVEPLSLDEAYLDVTFNLRNEPSARVLAQTIKSEIYEAVSLTSSAGVGPNKFIAKLASDYRKPDGLVVVPPHQAFAFVENLPVRFLWGVGPATSARLHQAGLNTTRDIRKQGLTLLIQTLGSGQAHFLWELSHGRDDRPVDPRFDPKSRGSECTFDHDVHHIEELLPKLRDQAEEIAQDLVKIQRFGRSVNLKIKYDDFTLTTRSRTTLNPTRDPAVIYHLARDHLLPQTQAGRRPIRLIGLSISQLLHEDEPHQLWFKFE